MTRGHSVAIVGIGGVFSQSPDLGAFWSNVAGGVSTSREVPEGRWPVRAADVYDPAIGAQDKVNSRRACFVEDFTPDLDDENVSTPAQVLSGLDPLFHLTLHAGVQAFRDAVMDDLDRSRAGVILGSIALPTSRASELSREWLGCTFEEKVLGDGARRPAPVNPLNRYVCGLPAALLARALGLGGGSFTVDAACASSLYALKLAVDELLSGRADAMLTGGVCCADSLYTQMGFSQLRALSPSGVCSPFDARADGLVVGEGAGVLVLKRVEDALRAGDHIYGVVRGIGLSNDVGGSLLAPLSEGQLRAMRAAYEQAGWTPQDVDLVECHATGTPVGDAVEFESLKALWGDTGWRAGQCVAGSVKSNVGHLLTGAGAAALIKVLLALKEKTLPPTANFSHPIPNLGMEHSPFKVLTRAAPWERRGAAIPRRAAVSAFGFGGVNGHVLVEEWEGSAPDAAVQADQPIQLESGEPVAVVGMAAHFGPWRSLRRFQERVLGGDDAVEPAASGRWWGVDQSAWFHEHGLDGRPFKGFYVDEASIRLDRFRVPPKELEEMLPQQLLLLDVAADAVEDGGLDRQDNLNTGVFVALGLDMNTTNFAVRWTLPNHAAEWARALGYDLSEEEMDDWADALREAAGPPLTANRTMGALGSIAASRVAREFRCGGSSFTLSSEETSGIRALEAAVRSLRKGEIGKAVVGAVDLAGDVRAALAAHSVRPYAGSGVARPMDAAADGPLVGEGAGAVVLKRLGDALRDGDRVYAVIKGIGVAAGGGVDQAVPLAGAYRGALARAYAEAGVAPESVGYVEAHGGGDPSEDAMEAQALADFFARETEDGVPCALGSVKADIGHAGAASGLASLIKACLCLYQEVVPPLRHCDAPRPEFAAAGSPFRVSRSPEYWLRNRVEGPRRAGVSAFGFDGNCAHVVLEALENEAARSDPTERLQPLGARDEALFAVEANNVAALSVELNRLRAHIEHAPDANMEALARLWWKENGEEPQKHRAVAFVARNGGELLKQIAFVRQWLAETPDRRIGAEEDVVWPIYIRDRVFYAPEPLGPSGKIAFVYPGSGNHYADMGRDIAVQWPEIHRKQDAQNQFLRAQYQPERFWEAGALDTGQDDHRAAIFGQVALGTAVTDLIQECGIRCDAVIGYSLGESAGLFALRAWTDRDEMLRRINSSTLFTTDLVGRYDAARKAWGLPPSKTVDWVLGIINRPSKAVLAALKDHKRVYRLIVNTLQESVIGGDRSAVERLVRKLECEFLPLPGVSSVHCEVARQVEKPYRELHLFETTPPRGVTFYSGASGRAYPVTRENAADAILAQAVHGVDFPKVVNAAYKDGIRFFVEMGPGASCSRMIDAILEGRPHVARSACVSGQAAVSSLLRVLAQLIAERAPVELGALYGQETRAVAHQTVSEDAAPPTLTVLVGGDPFTIPFPEVRVRVLDERDMSAEPVRLTAGVRAAPVEAATVCATERHPLTALVRQMTDTQSAKAQAHEAYLRFAERTRAAMADNLSLQTTLVAAMAASGNVSALERPAAASKGPVAFDRPACIEFAVGKIGKVLGPGFAEVDAHPTRVRLPDDPLMLVDRIVAVEGEPRSMTSGRVVTEHDVLPGAWYLDSGRIPTCIAIEAGQADLFLSGYLGIDFVTKGLAMYRLLDAEVTFYQGLPAPGSTIRYDIRIERFFHQGSTHFFRFQFDGAVDGAPLLSMRGGCAGFFTAEQLDAGRGIVRRAADEEDRKGTLPPNWESFVPLAVESYEDARMEALRRGDLSGCFGPLFEELPLDNPLRLPGGRMNLVHRILRLEPEGGRYGLGAICGEADIHPDDWFLTCHFVDDRVMPGTLMYECCLHTLRVFLLRIGWVGEQDEVVCEPVAGVTSRLKCRGQVVESTRKVTYEIVVKTLGYNPAPYAVADAFMYADGKAIVEITDMCVQFTGLTLEKIRDTWAAQREAPRGDGRARAVFDHESILTFANGGKPSEAFGEAYAAFDEGRFIARLPREPYQFLSRAVPIRAEQWKMAAGGVIRAEYDVPRDAWYFAADRQETMPFAVLLEVALQSCGWFAAYVGSALNSDADLHFRNLGGAAVQHLPVGRDAGTLGTEVTATNVSHSAGMIIQHYHFIVRNREAAAYEGDTYFGFFSSGALANQVGIRDAKPYAPASAELARATSFGYPAATPFPDAKLRMIDRIDAYIPDGGPHGNGFIRGIKRVSPDEWFFRAHFYQDPVWPGSLGLEAFLQLLKVAAAQRWGATPGTAFESAALGVKHAWVYRGQVVPDNEVVTVEAVVTTVDDEQRLIQASGLLSVDGRVIYEMTDFAIRMR